jgi:acyl-coenzyme A synthetase/AMP-(fatty) acid ligase
MNIIEAFERPALLRKNDPALIVGDYQATHAELLTMVCVLAARLVAAGVQRGDRVGVGLANPAASLSATMALAHIGAVSISLPVPLPDADLDAIGQRTGMQWLIHARSQPHALGCLPAERQLAFGPLGQPPEPGLRVPFPVDCAPDELWRVSLSSGTTGAHKGIEWTHGASVLIVGLRAGVMPTQPGDKVLLALDPAMNFALHNALRVLAAGACVVFPATRSADDILKACALYQPGQMVATTGLALAVLRARRERDGATAPLAHLRLLSVGGATLSPQMLAALRESVCPEVHSNYGATEMGMVGMADSALLDQMPHAVGRLLPWVEAQALDAQDQPLPPGQRGRLRFRSPAMSRGYSGADAAASDAYRDGWFHSNDVGAITRDGVILLEGREDDVLNLLGVKVDPARIEAVIEEDPAIVESAVVTVPDELGAPMLVAVIVAPSGADVQALMKRCAERLGGNCQPRGVVTVPALPRNAGGKIQRDLLRSQMRVGRKPADGAADTKAAQAERPAPKPALPDDALRFE